VQILRGDEQSTTNRSVFGSTYPVDNNPMKRVLVKRYYTREQTRERGWNNYATAVTELQRNFKTESKTTNENTWSE